MKIGGIDYQGLNEDILVFPRQGGDMVFKGRAVRDFDEFQRLCPAPQPPTLSTPRGVVVDEEDEGYRQQWKNYLVRRTSWLIIQTLVPSDIAWELVKPDKPGTWDKWGDELETVLSAAEQKQLVDFVLRVNSLDQAAIEKARQSFLRGLAAGPKA